MSSSSSSSPYPVPANSMSLAEKLQMKHASNGHQPMVEDTVDEGDIAHPLPSALPNINDAASRPVLEEVNPALSEKAMGKQKETLSTPSPALKKSNGFALDSKSDESFPALGGGGSKARNAATPLATWGVKNSPITAHGTANGAMSNGPLSSGTSSRASTPSALGTPLSPNTLPRSNGPHPIKLPGVMSLPGQHMEKLIFAPSQLLPKNELKKPINEIIRDINKKSKATVEVKSSFNGSMTFEGRGPLDEVRKALKEVAKSVGSKQSVKVPIPASIRASIIGRQGATIQAISKRTGANIQLPKIEDVPQFADDDDSVTIDVIIEGDAVAAELARQDIMSIVNERTSTVNIRLRDIPAEFFPFIAGPHNSSVQKLQEGREIQVKVPHYYSWTTQPPPPVPSGDAAPHFIPQPSSHIQISGDRRGALEARAMIERRVEALRRQLTLRELAINRGQHQFILGENGAGLHDLMRDTGCAIILPPPSDPTEMIVITGPSSKIEFGVEQVMTLAMSMQMSSLDVARQHNADAAYAQAITGYLQQKNVIADLEKLHQASIVAPSSGEGPWEVYARDGKNTIRARSDLVTIIGAHPPARLRRVDMDPYFHQQLRGQQAMLHQEHGVHMIVPRENEQSSQIVLVYEGPHEHFEVPRQRPSPSDVTIFQEALRKAHEHVLSMASGQDIGAKVLEIPSKFSDKIRKFSQRQQDDLADGILPLHFKISDVNGDGEKRPPLITMTIRGPVSRLDGFAAQIADFIVQQDRDELERGFTMSFDFPQKFANYLIGKRGESINKLRDEFDVDIQVNAGKVDLKGPQAKAEAAKLRILSMGKKWADEATHVLKIKPQYHRELIGAKGNQVNRLQERYNVRVQFPRSSPSIRDDESMVDGASEAGARGHRPNQAPDEVIVRGPRKGADEAREELLSLLQWTIDNGHSSVVSVAQNQLPSLIGQGGREMERVRESTGARIDVPGNREVADASGRVEIKIRGTKKQVDDATKLLEGRAKVFDNTVTRSITVDKKHHKMLIGTGGANLRNLVLQAGGSDDRRELARTVRFPSQESKESTITIEGDKLLVDKLVAAIESFVSEKATETTEMVEVAPEKHRVLIGQGGETRRALESKLGVSIDIPRQTAQGAARSHIKLAGTPEKVAAAKSHILDMVKSHEGLEVLVPCAMHHLISDNGQFFRRLRNDHKVTVDHNGVQPPPKATTNGRSRVNGGGSLPLITDDHPDGTSISWEIIDQSGGPDDEGEIPWVLRGSTENVAKARAILQKSMDQAKNQAFAGYLILPDPQTYRFIIGQGGSQINAIRKQTGCKITVPRDQAKGEAIEIVGGKDGVEKAKDIILDVVQNGASGPGSHGLS